MNSTYWVSSNWGLGPHPRVQVYKKEVNKTPFTYGNNKWWHIFSLFVPFFLEFCILKSKKNNELKELKCFLPTQFLYLSLSSHYHLPPPILHEWIGHIVADSKKHTHTATWISGHEKGDSKQSQQGICLISCSLFWMGEWVIIKSWICFPFNRCWHYYRETSTTTQVQNFHF